ncbi:MAG: beta-ketoacyl-[acyl-carrier-protein] synthase family protein [Verrucomicrobiae bacterium]|nr:beta-ketoacyl-[acyl-carrier-protein] synthase family protein [Verrucomicrobiae bacterium]
MSVLHQLLRDHPVVITGRGALTVAGPGVASLWQAVQTGRSLAEAWRNPAAPAAPPAAVCRVANLPPVPQAARKLDRSARLGFAAALEAWHDARLHEIAPPPRRIGVITASSRGTVEVWEKAFAALHQGQTPPSFIASTTIAHLSGALSLHLNLQGPMLAASATCASSAAALALAAQQLLTGAADVILAGGAEAPLHPVVLQGFDTAGLLAHHPDPAQACRPFDLHRNGTVLGEGAGFLVLETLESARRRGATIYGQLAGWALGAEAYDRAGMHPDGQALAQVIHEALAVAGLPPGAIGYLNLHGTGTQLNDASEARAVQHVFGPPAAQPPASSTKPVFGHCMGAGAALEAIVCLEAQRHQLLPPAVNCPQPDPHCPIALARSPAPPRPIQATLSLSAGFWGAQAALVFRAAP